jgi:hypothetical protein
MLTLLGAAPMLVGMVPDAYVYRRANRLIEQHGDDALLVATELVLMALKRREKDRAMLMMRIRSAVEALQAPPSERLN